MDFSLYTWAAAQIVLESFPISSSGHTRLLAYFVPFAAALPGHAIQAISYAVHFSTACIIAFYFRREWSFPFRHYRRCMRLLLKISLYTAVATCVTLIGYAIRQLFLCEILPLWAGFFLTGCVLLSLYWCPEKPYKKLDLKKSVLLGAIQACAFAPGVSRLACTYVGARYLGLSARRAFEISWLVQWPLILCASLYGISVLYSDGYKLLNPMSMWVMLGSSSLAYAGLYMQEIMVRDSMMWLWSTYMILPLICAFILEGRSCMQYV